MKVCLLGASGGIGQPLSLLLKMNTSISELALYDIKQAATPCVGVAADVAHINTPCSVKGYAGDDEIGAALKGTDVVVMTAGVPRKPGMTRDDLFNINAKIVYGLSKSIVEHCPDAVVLIISNPVNSTVPICVEVFKKANKFNWRKIIGVTTLDVVRANTFVAQAKNLDATQVKVPVIGGHAGETILAVLSQTSPPVSFSDSEIESLDKHVQNAGTDVVEAKAGAGSATLSMAYAASVFTSEVIKGLSGDNVETCCYFENSGSFIASKVLLGKSGIEKDLGFGNLTAYENTRLTQAKNKLAGDVKNGLDFVSKC